MSPILGIIASQNYVRTPPNSYESIATVNVGAGGQSTISFSSIPSTYKHLQLRWIAQTNRGTYGFDDLYVRFNSDASNSYALHVMYGNGSTVAVGSDTTATVMNIINSAGTTTSGSWWGTAIADILDYSNTSKYKTMRYLDGIDLNGAGVTLPGRVNFGSGLYQNTTAINAITITSATASTFQQYSSFALYGIKG